ncbi:hypothetical protein MC885_001623 [Smutsia gigantea]|nr:hypothetical protein MC885_001623 [Smutsia gigantea]
MPPKFKRHLNDDDVTGSVKSERRSLLEDDSDEEEDFFLRGPCGPRFGPRNDKIKHVQNQLPSKADEGGMQDNLLLSHLFSGRPRLLVQQEWRDQGMTPRPRPFPRPSGLRNPLDRRLHQGWGGGTASHFRAELSMNQEGKGNLSAPV